MGRQTFEQSQSQTIRTAVKVCTKRYRNREHGTGDGLEGWGNLKLFPKMTVFWLNAEGCLGHL